VQNEALVNAAQAPIDLVADLAIGQAFTGWEEGHRKPPLARNAKARMPFHATSIISRRTTISPRLVNGLAALIAWAEVERTNPCRELTSAA